MLCIWWYCRGIVHYELLPANETITAKKYCEQLDRRKASVAKKRPALLNRRGVVFHHDNARPHTSLLPRSKLIEFSWDVLPHPPYSPDPAPSDYHLFRSLQNSLNGKNFDSLEGVKNHLKEFFAKKTESFWKKGIFDLPHRWAQVSENNGSYFVQ